MKPSSLRLGRCALAIGGGEEHLALCKTNQLGFTSFLLRSCCSLSVLETPGFPPTGDAQANAPTRRD